MGRDHVGRGYPGMGLAGTTGVRALGGKSRPVGLPQVYRGRGRRTLRDIYDNDHGAAPPGGRFRWLFSTVLAATVGSVAILVVLYGSADTRDGADSFLPAIQRMSSGAMPTTLAPYFRKLDGLNWATPKSDRMQVTSGATSTRFVIHETMKQRRNGREYIQARPFVRVVARLAPPPESARDSIPAFNPFKLYADANPISEGGDSEFEPSANPNAQIRVLELLGGILPVEDGQHLDPVEVAEIVARAESALRSPEADASPLDTIEAGTQAGRSTPTAQNTTVLVKTASDETDTETVDSDDGEVTVTRVEKGDRLEQILVRGGADKWQAKAMVESARGLFRDADLSPGLEVHLTLVASLTDPGRKELSRFSVFADGHVHKVTVRRGASGEFEASATPVGSEAAMRALLSDDDDGAARGASLYAGIYHALLLQNVPAETIVQLLKVHAYDTDYRRRLRAGDQLELFFDVKEEGAGELPLGELLYTSITAGGETSRFYRYRSPDGGIDYFDDQGNNSKRFLLRRPVRGADVRLTSGFGVRFHPLLNDRKMHTGVDWAAAPGTPILAAGNGVIEQAGRKGAYGNYVRIRHANGYQTAYGHMSRIAPNARDGVKVRQGQVIGYVGSTGLSSGPHLHFEVLVNTRFVNPMSIQVPRERQLDGKQLAEFQKERARIEELMHRAPVMSASK